MYEKGDWEKDLKEDDELDIQPKTILIFTIIGSIIYFFYSLIKECGKMDNKR
jgi:hypothetical protein